MRKKALLLSALAGFLLIPVSVSFACGIEGKATRTGGPKVDGTARVSTSWNNKEAYPRGGYYSISQSKRK